MQHGFEISQIVLSLNCKTIELKTLNLVINLSLISNKAPNLFTAICSEINTVSKTNLILRLNIRGSYKLRFSLKIVTINWKKIL